MYTSEYYLDRGNKFVLGCIHQVIRLCFGMYTSEYYLSGNKTLFWDVYIRVLPEPW